MAFNPSGPKRTGYLLDVTGSYRLPCSMAAAALMLGAFIGLQLKKTARRQNRGLVRKSSGRGGRPPAKAFSDQGEKMRFPSPEEPFGPQTGLASINTKAIRHSSSVRLLQAWLVPRWIRQSPAFSNTSPSSMTAYISPDRITA